MSSFLTIFGIDLLNVFDIVAKPLALAAVVAAVISVGYSQGGFYNS